MRSSRKSCNSSPVWVCWWTRRRVHRFECLVTSFPNWDILALLITPDRFTLLQQKERRFLTGIRVKCY